MPYIQRFTPIVTYGYIERFLLFGLRNKTIPVIVLFMVLSLTAKLVII